MEEEREAGDQMNQFHRNEAISAVADESFIGEEDDDYEDLYNDVNVSEGFLQTLRKNDDVLKYNNRIINKPNDEEEKKVDLIINPGGVANVGESSNVNWPRVSGANFENSENNQNLVFSGPVGSGGTGGQSGGGGLRVELGQEKVKAEVEEQVVSHGNSNINGGVPGIIALQMHSVGIGGGNEGLMRRGSGVGVGSGGGNVNNGGGNSNSIIVGNGGGGFGGGGTILFVGDLHWWTTDAELESELFKYGPVKEVKFFDEKASGKSKGYCQVEFYDQAVAMACKENMNGHVFNGRPCIVAFASPYSVKKMGDAQVNRNQQTAQSAVGQPRRGVNNGEGKNGGSNIATGGNYQGGDNNRSAYGRGNWGRGNMQGRGPVGQMRGRGPGGIGGRGIMGNGGNGFGQGIGGAPPMMHPQSIGFDPGFGAPMGRIGSYGGFPGPHTPFSGVMPSFPPVGGIGLPGVAPHINALFFNNRMPMNGMGRMMPASGVEGPNMGMWSDPSMGGWGGDEQGAGRAGESSYGEEAASDHQYGEVSHDRGGGQNPMKDKDKNSERDWSGSAERRYRDDREVGFDRDMPREKDVGHDHDWAERGHRDDKGISLDRDRERDRDREHSKDRDRYRDREQDRDRERERYRDDRDRHGDHHRYRDREPEHDDDWDRGRSSRTHSKPRLAQDDEHRLRSRDADYGKRRRFTSD